MTRFTIYTYMFKPINEPEQKRIVAKIEELFKHL